MTCIYSIIGFSAFILSLLAILCLYACFALQVRWHLEMNHSEFAGKSDFPKKLSRTMYLSTPRTGGNWLRFVYSRNDLNDPAVRQLKAGNRAVIFAALVWVILFCSYCFRETGSYK